MEQVHVQWWGTIIFALAVLHTFCIKVLMRLANQFPSGSVGENLFHLLGEVEVVFGLWGAVLFLVYSIGGGVAFAVEFVESGDFTEPLFVFVIMAIAATKPLVSFAHTTVNLFVRALPLSLGIGYFVATLIVGPLLGSLITEPGAMALSALLLRDYFESKALSASLKYLTLGILFVNVSVGGTLTAFAAPPVVMVARPWGWTTAYMLSHFGFNAFLTIAVNACIGAWLFRKELSGFKLTVSKSKTSPFVMIVLHLLFLLAVVLSSHHPRVLLWVFLFFLGFANVTREYQSPLKLREAGLVGFFLAGLVLLGSLQRWWMEPLINSLGPNALYFGATALTALVDNAALTFLVAQVPDVSEALKYFVVAGAVTGGGLTIIANAPNPIGFSMLKNGFGRDGISPLGLFLGALGPTLIAILCFWGFHVFWGE